MVVLACGAMGVGAAVANVSKSTPSYARTSTRALSSWSGFPVNAEPRPVIPLGGGTVSLPRFRNLRDQDAVDEGSVRLDAVLPHGRSSINGYRLIGAQRAYRELRGDSKPRIGSVPVLDITSVRFGRAVFLIDRGDVRLPAWLFFFRGFRQPASVLAVRPYRTPATWDFDPALHQAAVSDRGRRLELLLFGGPAGTQGCDDRYTTHTASSREAVVVSIIDQPVPPPPGEACALDAVPVTLFVLLPQPLGNRVLVDSASDDAVPAAARRLLPWLTVTPP